MNGTSSGAEDEAADDGFTAEELRLGKRASKYMNILCLAAFGACVGIAIFVFLNVPWDTRMPYDGKYNRSGSGIPMQIAMLPALVVLFGLWRAGRKPDSHEMRAGSRIGVYTLGTALIVGCVVSQWVMAIGILIAGGYFPE
jgi:hypothetical protein